MPKTLRVCVPGNVRGRIRDAAKPHAPRRAALPGRISALPKQRWPGMSQNYFAHVQHMTKMLESVDRWLDKAVEHAKAKSFDPEVLLQARLAPDMYPLMRQLQTVC